VWRTQSRTSPPDRAGRSAPGKDRMALARRLGKAGRDLRSTCRKEQVTSRTNRDPLLAGQGADEVHDEIIAEQMTMLGRAGGGDKNGGRAATTRLAATLRRTNRTSRRGRAGRRPPVLTFAPHGAGAVEIRNERALERSAPRFVSNPRLARRAPDGATGCSRATGAAPAAPRPREAIAARRPVRTAVSYVFKRVCARSSHRADVSASRSAPVHVLRRGSPKRVRPSRDVENRAPVMLTPSSRSTFRKTSHPACAPDSLPPPMKPWSSRRRRSSVDRPPS